MSAFFDISESVVYAWRKQLRETGDVSPRKRENKPRKANYEELLRIVRENPSLLQVEIAKMINTNREILGEFKEICCTNNGEFRKIERGCGLRFPLVIPDGMTIPPMNT